MGAREDLVQAVLKADSEANGEATGGTDAKPTVEETTEQIQETANVVTEDANQKAEVEKKTALQKRLDKLTRDRKEAIERANELQRLLDEKNKVQPSVSEDLDIEVDEQTNKFLDKFDE